MVFLMSCSPRHFPAAQVPAPCALELQWLGIRSSNFMLLYGVVWVSLVIMYITEVRRTQISGEKTA